MPMRVDDTLLGPKRGDVAAVLAFANAQGAARVDEVEAYARELYRLAPKVGLDPAILASQSAEETGNWTSVAWNKHLNPAGIGITDNEDVGITYTDGADAAHAQIVHAFVYTSGPIPDGHVLAQFIPRDPRYQAVIGGHLAGTVQTIQDLTGKWATDPHYHEEIVNRSKLIFPNLPDQPNGVGNMELNMAKGLIPMPTLIDHIVDVSQRCTLDPQPDGSGRGYDLLGSRSIDALFVHRSQGTWTSNINHFDSFCPGALTDLQVDNEDGRMMRFVRLNPPHQETDAPSGWASGPTHDDAHNLIAVGDALKLIQMHGGDGSAVNRFAESVEVTGFFGPNGDDPISDAARNTIAQWFASRAHDYGIPWDSFPMIPDEGRSFICGHRESRGGNEGDCPGDFLWSLIATHDADLIVRARKIMKKAQTKNGPNGDDKFHKFDGGSRVFHTQQGAVGRSGPSRDNPIVMHFQAGEAITADGFFTGQFVEGDDRWLRIKGSSTVVHTSGVVESI